MSSVTSYRRTAILGAVIGVLSFTNADIGLATNLNPSGAGCVDPKGFLACYQAEVNQATSCVQTCGENQECILGCSGYQLAGNIGCWIQSCWNMAYSCEYQGTAIQYLAGTDLIQDSVHIPFYPAPDSVPGQCSCNIGYIYGNVTYIDINDPCITAATISEQNASDCICCKDSLAISNSLNACPKSDLSTLGFASTLTSYQKILSQISPDKCSILDTSATACISRYGITNAGPTWYNPLNLPAGEPGTEKLSNLPGNSFTVFGARSVTVALFPGYMRVVTPVAFDAGNAAATASGGGGLESVAVGTGSVVVTAGTGTGKPQATATGGPGASGTVSVGSAGSSAGPATPSKTSGAVRMCASGGGLRFAVLVGLLCGLRIF